MGKLVDSSVIIAVERGRSDLWSVLEQFEEEALAVSAITCSELLHGVHRAVNEVHRTRREVFVEALLARIPVVPFDTIAARTYARLWAQTAASGIQIDTHDLIIASTAMAIGFGVITRDKKSFPRIPGLEVVLLTGPSDEERR
jgi:predicted nucleic acid-binding protein